jgi:hypothetical protein
MKNDKALDAARIRQLADNWAKAVRAKDIDALMSHYTPDILVFDLAPPLQYNGIDAYRKTSTSGSPRSKGQLGTRYVASASARAKTWPSATASIGSAGREQTARKPMSGYAQPFAIAK